MKNLSLFSLFVMAVLFLVSCGGSKNASQGYNREKELNEKISEYTNGGWKIHGTTRTLRGKLTEHYEKMDANQNLYELIGTSTGCRSITVCRASALNAAAVTFASRQGQELKGKTLRDMGIDEGAATPNEFNKFLEACIAHYQASIKGDLQESIAFIKQTGSGTNEYQIFFLVDKNVAGRKLADAIKGSIEESNLRGEYANSVKKFINDGIE